EVRLGGELYACLRAAVRRNYPRYRYLRRARLRGMILSGRGDLLSVERRGFVPRRKGDYRKGEAESSVIEGPFSPSLQSLSMRIAVLGAGPAGGAAALVLARGGAAVDVYLPERPGEKPCGGAVPEHVLPRVAGFDPSGLPAVRPGAVLENAAG